MWLVGAAGTGEKVRMGSGHVLWSVPCFCPWTQRRRLDPCSSKHTGRALPMEHAPLLPKASLPSVLVACSALEKLAWALPQRDSCPPPPPCPPTPFWGFRPSSSRPPPPSFNPSYSPRGFLILEPAPGGRHRKLRQAEGNRDRRLGKAREGAAHVLQHSSGCTSSPFRRGSPGSE